MNRFGEDAAHPPRIDEGATCRVRTWPASSARAGTWPNLALRRSFAVRRRESSEGRSGDPFDISGRTRNGPPVSGERLIIFRAVPVAILVFVGILVAISWRTASRDEERVVGGEAAANIELLPSVVADDLDRRPARSAEADVRSRRPPDPIGSPATRLAGRDRHGNEAGDVIASVPPGIAKASLSDELGASPLMIFADKAGVMLRIALPSGEEALATVRTLRRPFGGQVAVMHPDGWRAGRLARRRRNRSIVLLVSVTAVLAALACGYSWQAGRAGRIRYELPCHARARIDTVLSSGPMRPLGLGPRQRPRIYWSLSMFEIIGTAAAQEGRCPSPRSTR